jgi:hypothetical protein
VEPYSTALVVQGSEAERHAGGVFDEAVAAFGTGVGDSGFEEAEYFWPPGVDGGGEGVHLGNVTRAHQS